MSRAREGSPFLSDGSVTSDDDDEEWVPPKVKRAKHRRHREPNERIISSQPGPAPAAARSNKRVRVTASAFRTQHWTKWSPPPPPPIRPPVPRPAKDRVTPRRQTTATRTQPAGPTALLNPPATSSNTLKVSTKPPATHRPNVASSPKPVPRTAVDTEATGSKMSLFPQASVHLPDRRIFAQGPRPLRFTVMSTCNDVVRSLVEVSAFTSQWLTASRLMAAYSSHSFRIQTTL